VARIVRELTNDSRLPKAERHEAMLRHAPTMSPEANLIKLADRYDNLCSMHVWDAERQGRYLAVSRILLDGLAGTCAELERRIAALIDAGTVE